eukprot:CAMPEP_0203864300 /NCGR_PEP_ID=MMETSP0359-20131031/14682_1 /ASSEMBLY_ACC=CAM_ASM_000338 /TAXON_ID=268821 /ORGANISM="Scrippsiella Hangoei, Strain SHTV-5" /LENGTH=94 /DNA_ID=CAMNT_0050782009 /DNA_START=117 /DNA_END=397 /DNA_ORIENTATION=+
MAQHGSSTWPARTSCKPDSKRDDVITTKVDLSDMTEMLMAPFNLYWSTPLNKCFPESEVEGRRNASQKVTWMPQILGCRLVDYTRGAGKQQTIT